MNWPLPQMEEAEVPAQPRLWVWGIALLLMLVGGFLLAVYVMPETELSDKPHLLTVAAGGPFLLWLLFLGLRLMAADIPRAAVSTRNQELELRRRQWRRWANQGMCLLAENRLTALDESGRVFSAGGELPVNQHNRLELHTLSDLPIWERNQQLLTTLLEPIARWHQQNAGDVPLSLCWKISSSTEEDWPQLLSQVAEQLALPLTAVTPLAEAGLTGWLTTACDAPPQGVCCLLFIELNDHASQEAAALVLASDAQCRALKLSPLRRVMRPLLTPFTGLAEALRLQCDQQQAAKKLYTSWYSAVPGAQVETLQLTCTAQQLACGASRLYDADSMLGIPGVAREAVMLSLVARSSGAAQLFSADQGQCCLWQVQVPGGRA